jgi:hypothetical protein
MQAMSPKAKKKMIRSKHSISSVFGAQSKTQSKAFSEKMRDVKNKEM